MSIREGRSAIRSAYTLARLEDDEAVRSAMLDVLERHHERLLECVWKAVEAMEAEDVRNQVLIHAAQLLPKDAPLRLVKDVYDGETVA